MCFARSYYRLDGLFDVVSVRAHFFGLMVRVEGNNIVSHCANPPHASFPSMTDVIPARNESATITGQSTLRPLNVVTMNLAQFFGMASGRG